MVPEAPLEQTEAGLVPAGPGWFVLNACGARWRHREGRGESLPFEGRTDFPQIGITLFVLGPGEPIGMYHWARAMIAARAADEPVTSLLQYVAFNPWEDGGKEYLVAFNAGWVTELRAFCPGDEAWLGIDETRRRGEFTGDAVIVERR